jgi:hypothetical protein
MSNKKTRSLCYVTPHGRSAGGKLAPAARRACIRVFNCAMVIAGSAGLVSARITTLRGTLARSASLLGDQRMDIRAARSWGPVIIPSAPEADLPLAEGRSLPAVWRHAAILKALIPSAFARDAWGVR